MIFLIVIGLLFIAIIVAAVLSARNEWYWLNPVLLVFIFIAGVVGVAAMSQTLQLRLKAMKKVADVTQRAERAAVERQRVIFGDLKSSTYGPESLRGINQQLELLQLGRGRVWDGGTVANENGKIKFTFAQEQAKVDNKDLSLVNAELVAFAVDAEGVPSFVGKVRVTSQSPTELTLEQSVPIANFKEMLNHPQRLGRCMSECLLTSTVFSKISMVIVSQTSPWLRTMSSISTGSVSF